MTGMVRRNVRRAIALTAALRFGIGRHCRS